MHAIQYCINRRMVELVADKTALKRYADALTEEQKQLGKENLKVYLKLRKKHNNNR